MRSSLDVRDRDSVELPEEHHLAVVLAELVVREPDPAVVLAVLVVHEPDPAVVPAELVVHEPDPAVVREHLQPAPCVAAVPSAARELLS